MPQGVKLTQESVDAWADVWSALHKTLHRSAIVFWIEPCPLAGELDGCLVIAGPARCTAWVRRRYAKAIGKAIRDLTPYRGLRVYDA